MSDLKLLVPFQPMTDNRRIFQIVRTQAAVLTDILKIPNIFYYIFYVQRGLLKFKFNY